MADLQCGARGRVSSQKRAAECCESQIEPLRRLHRGLRVRLGLQPRQALEHASSQPQRSSATRPYAPRSWHPREVAACLPSHLQAMGADECGMRAGRRRCRSGGIRFLMSVFLITTQTTTSSPLLHSQPLHSSALCLYLHVPVVERCCQLSITAELPRAAGGPACTLWRSCSAGERTLRMSWSPS